jgi:hypothetical protein
MHVEVAASIVSQITKSSSFERVLKWHRWSTLTDSEQGSVDGPMTDVGGSLSGFLPNFAFF